MTNLEKIQEIMNGLDENKRNKLMLNLKNEFCIGICSKKSRFRCSEKCGEKFSQWLGKKCTEKSSFWKRF